jgi:hypothetical protein
VKPATIRTYSVRALHRYLDHGIFAVPRLQREFVWNGRKAADLLDSIYRKMPIGNLLVWDTEKSNQHLLRHNLHVLPHFKSHNSRIWFLIDGQQRLSVLHQTTAGATKVNSDGREVDFTRICFRLSPGNGGDQYFEYRRPIEGEFESIIDILNARWRHRLRHLTKPKLDRVARCREAILSYQVPLVFCCTNDIDEVRDLFVRINSLGTPIGSADRAFARASSLDLREMAYETRELLPTSFRQIPYESILQAFAFVAEARSTDVGQRAYESAIRKWERRVVVNEGEREKLVHPGSSWVHS